MPPRRPADGRLFVVVPVLLFLLWQGLLADRVHIAQYDEAIFLDVARNIRLTGTPLRSVGAEGKMFFDHTPAYLYLLSGVTAVFGDSADAARVVNYIAGLATILVVFHLAWAAGGPVAGLIAASLVALNPFFNIFSYFVRMEAPFMLAVVVSVYLLWRAERPGSGPGRYWAAGVAIAAAVLFKEHGLAFWGAAGLYVLTGPDPRRARLGRAVVVGAPAALAFILWLAYAWRLDAARLQATLDRWMGSIAGGGGIDPRLGVAPVDWLLGVGGQVTGWPLVGLLGLAGAVALWRRRRPPRIAGLLLLYLALAIGASLVVELKEMRHLIAIIPVGALAAALLVDWDGAIAALRARPSGLAVVGAAAVVVAWAAAPVRVPLGTGLTGEARWWTPGFANRAFVNDPYFEPIRAAGEYLGRVAAPGEVIAVVRQGPVVGYYAARPYELLYTRPYDENVALIAASRFVVVDEPTFFVQSPAETLELLARLETTHAVDRVFDGPLHSVTVYRRR